MFSSKLFNLGGIVLGIVALVGVGFLWNRPDALSTLTILRSSPESVTVGAINTKFVGVLPTYISGGGISATVGTIGITSLTIKQTNQPLAMTDFGSVGYITLEPGSVARQEFASFTGITQNSNGTAVLTGVTRGLSPVYPYTASTTVAFAHGGGTTVIVSNSPPFYSNFAVQNNDATISGTYTFSSTSQPVYDGTPTLTNPLAFVNLSYLNGLVANGVATSSETQFGGVWLGTALQTASSTNEKPNKPYVLQTVYATDTPQSGCAVGYTSTAGAGCTVVATLAGKIRQTFLDIFSTANTWTQPNLFTASTTINATTTIAADSLTNRAFVINTAKTQWPSSNSFGVLNNDSTGLLTWKNPTKISYAGVGPSALGSGPTQATTTLFTIPSGVMSASSTITVDFQGPGNTKSSGTQTNFIHLSVGGASLLLSTSPNSSSASNKAFAFSGHCLISFQSVTAQRWSCQGISIESAATAVAVPLAGSSSGTSAIDFSGAQTLYIDATSQASAESLNINSLSVIVNP